MIQIIPRFPIAALLASLLWSFGTLQSFAADFGGDCCADLEERVAELEATTARKGNRKVSLTVSGHLSQALLFWDDGVEQNVYVVGNANDSYNQSDFHINGEAQITADWTAGFQFTIRVNNALSADVNQFDDDGASELLSLWEAYWYVGNTRWGQLSVGQASRASDGAPESDLSKTRVAAFSGVQSTSGGFFLRRDDGALTDVVWAELIDFLNGDTANVVRYDTPTFMGFAFAATYGEDDIWDVGATYEGERGEFEFNAALAYTQSTDENGLDGFGAEIDNSVVVGSFAVLHKPSGLNALFAAGQRSFDQQVEAADGSLLTPEDANYIYTKVGWIRNWMTLGSTAFYGEYSRFKNFAPADLDGVTVASVATGGVCSTPGNCRISGSEVEVWGLGVVQWIEPAAMQIYLGYRHFEADLSLVDARGQNQAAAGLKDFQIIKLGSIIAF
jgi:predicted porin